MRVFSPYGAGLDLEIYCTNFSKYKQLVYCSRIKLFSNLLANIKSLNHNIKMFKPALKEYLLFHSYTIEEFTQTKNSQLS
jgi:hypothetical protein